MMNMAQEFWPTSAAGWIPLLVFLGSVIGGGWVAMNKIVSSIDRINTVPELEEKVDALDRGQIAILAKLDDIQAGMVTAAEMQTHTNQDAELWDQFSRRLSRIEEQGGSKEQRRRDR